MRPPALNLGEERERETEGERGKPGPRGDEESKYKQQKVWLIKPTTESTLRRRNRATRALTPSPRVALGTTRRDGGREIIAVTKR